MIGYRLMGMSLLATGDIAESQAHLDRAIALYDPGEHRPLATRFGQDLGVSTLSYRSFASWFLGYPEAALATADLALKDAREIGQAATLMYTLNFIPLTYIYCGDYAAAKAQADEVVALADEKGSLFWKAFGMMNQGCILALTGKASDAVQTLTCNHGISINRSNIVHALVPIRFGNELCGTGPIR
jgi:tetratricopeptide (TPR) repeat protein